MSTRLLVNIARSCGEARKHLLQLRWLTLDIQKMMSSGLNVDVGGITKVMPWGTHMTWVGLVILHVKESEKSRRKGYT